MYIVWANRRTQEHCQQQQPRAHADLRGTRGAEPRSLGVGAPPEAGPGPCRGQGPFTGPAAQPRLIRTQHSTQLQAAPVSTGVKITGLLHCTNHDRHRLRESLQIAHH